MKICIWHLDSGAEASGHQTPEGLQRMKVGGTAGPEGEAGDVKRLFVSRGPNFPHDVNNTCVPVMSTVKYFFCFGKLLIIMIMNFKLQILSPTFCGAKEMLPKLPPHHR